MKYMKQSSNIGQQAQFAVMKRRPKPENPDGPGFLSGGSLQFAAKGGTAQTELGHLTEMRSQRLKFGKTKEYYHIFSKGIL